MSSLTTDQFLGKMYVQQARGVGTFKLHQHIKRPKNLMDIKDIQLRKKANKELAKIFYKDADKKGKY